MNHYSLSQAKTYQQCPYKWYLSQQYEPLAVKDALTLGKVVHECIAHLYAYPPDERDFRIMEAKLNTIWSEYQQYSVKAWEPIHNKAFDYCMRHWQKYNQDIDYWPEHIEHSFWYNYEEMFDIVIRPDMILRRLDGSWLYSLKTGKPNRENIMLDDPQEAFYAYILRKLDMPIVGAIYEIIYENGEISREEMEFHTGELHDMSIDLFDTMLAIEEDRKDSDEGTFKRHRGWTCGFCEYRLICRSERLGMNRKQVIKDNFKERE